MPERCGHLSRRVLSRLATAAAGLLLGLLLSARAIAAQPSAFPDVQDVLDKGVLVVAVLADDFEPFVDTDEHAAPTGFDPMLAHEIARALGVEVRFDRSASSFDAVIDLVAEGSADLGVSFLTRTTPRAQRVLFSTPYVEQQVTLLINRLDALAFSGRCPDLPAVLDLLKKRGQVGALRGSAFAQGLARFAATTDLTLYDTGAELWKAVAAREIGVSIQGELLVERFLRVDPSVRLHVELCTLDHFPTHKISIAIRPDAPNLLRIVDQLLADRDIHYSVDEILTHSGVWPWELFAQ